MRKLKVRDKVKIREDLYLKEGELIQNFYVNDNMAKISGKIVTIKEVCDGYYTLVENIWNWTEEMFEPIDKDEDSKNTQEDPLISFEGIEYQEDKLGFLTDEHEIEFIESIKNNKEGIIDISDYNMTYNDIPNIISWLQDIYTYGQQQLNNKIEYVDFNTALAWMKEDKKHNEAQLDGVKYNYKHGNLWKYSKNEDSWVIAILTLPAIESKEWILIKED